MNKILTSLNQALAVQIYSLVDSAGNPVESSTLSGLPLGTSDGSSTGELGLKVILLNQAGPLPFGADTTNIEYVAAGPSIVHYIKDEVEIATATITYENSGASASDRPLSVVYTN